MRRILSLIFFLILLSPAAQARRIKSFSELAYPQEEMLSVDDGYDEMSWRIEEKLLEGEGPFRIALTGETGAGQSTIANLYAERWQGEKGYEVLVVGGDNFIIPKELRTPPGAKYPSWVIDFSKETTFKIGLLGIEIRKLGEASIEVVTPTASYRVRFETGKVPIWKLPGPTEIEIEYQGGDKYVLNSPTFVAKFQMSYYALVREVSEGRVGFMPLFDQVTRDWRKIEAEELRRLMTGDSRREGNYLHLAKESRESGRDIWVDVNTGIVYERIDPRGKDIIIFENIWNLLDPAVAGLFDDYMFVYAPQLVREYNFGVRHIFEGRYRYKMLRSIVEESSGKWWQEQRRFVERQLEVVLEKGGIVIDNSQPFEEMAIARATKMSLDERIRKAIEVFNEDWEANYPGKKIDPVVLLDYVAHARIFATPLYSCIQKIIEALEKERIDREENSRQELEEFLAQFPEYGMLNIFEKALLDYALVKAGLMPPALPALKPSWKWEDIPRELKTEWREVPTRVESALSDDSQGIPYPVLATVYYLEKQIGNSILNVWGFEKFVQGFLQRGNTAFEAAALVGKVYPYICNVIYAMKKIQHYVKIPQQPRVLILGAGDLAWGLHLYKAIPAGELDGVDIRDLQSGAEGNLDRWGLRDAPLRFIQGDVRNLAKISQLRDRKYDLIIIRTPFKRLSYLSDVLEDVGGYLKPKGKVILYTLRDELESEYRVPKAILEGIEELKLLGLNIYTLNPRMSLLHYVQGDLITVVEDVKKFYQYLQKALQDGDR